MTENKDEVRNAGNSKKSNKNCGAKKAGKLMNEKKCGKIVEKHNWIQF